MHTHGLNVTDPNTPAYCFAAHMGMDDTPFGPYIIVTQVFPKPGRYRAFILSLTFVDQTTDVCADELQ